MVAKDIFPFATVTDGCKEASFMGFPHEYGILGTTFRKVTPQVWFLLLNLPFCNCQSWLQGGKYPLQPLLMVAKP